MTEAIETQIYPQTESPVSAIDQKIEALTLLELKPYYDCVFILPEEEIMNTSGFFMPPQFKKKPMTGIVVEVGEGRTVADGRIIPLKTKKGERVLFDRFASLPFKINGIEVYLTRETQIFSKLKSQDIVVETVV